MIAQSRLMAREFARRQPNGADIFRLPRPPGASPPLISTFWAWIRQRVSARRDACRTSQ